MREPRIFNLHNILLPSLRGGARAVLSTARGRGFYLYFLNLPHIITPADVSPNGNPIHTPIKP